MRSVLIAAILVTSCMIPMRAYADVKIGNIKVKDDGSIVFVDGSTQSTATAQGPKGDKGDEGAPGQVKKDTLCELYLSEGVNLPPFCFQKKYL